MILTDDRFLTAGPLLSDRTRIEPSIPERVRLNKDRVEWQFGAGRYVPTKFQERTNGRPLTSDLVLTIQRQRDAERLNDFFELASGEAALIKEFVWKWGPLEIFPEAKELQQDDPWREPSPEYRSVLEASGNEVEVTPIYSEPCWVYSQLASFARAIVDVGRQLRYGVPVESVRNLPAEFRQATLTLNGGPAKLVFESDADTDAERLQDLRLQQQEIDWFVNQWLRTAGVSLAIGRTVNGETYVAAWCVPDSVIKKAWLAAQEAGKPFTSSHWNPEIRQFQEIPIPCPSVLSGLLACHVAAILVRPSGWGLCPCGKMFRKLGRQVYCGEECTYRRSKRREDTRLAKARFDAKKRR